MVDDAVCYYKNSNMTKTRDYMVTEKNVDPAIASELVKEINVGWIKVHQASLALQAIIMMFFLVLFAFGLYLFVWYLMIMGFIFGVLRIFSVVSLVMEIHKRKQDILF